jgi:hypothetical protein
MSKRHNDHQKINEVLASFVENNKLEKGLDSVNVANAWRELMGNGVNNYTSSIKLHKGTLYVALSSSVLREELAYGKDKIIAMINEELGKEVIKKVIFKIKKTTPVVWFFFEFEKSFKTSRVLKSEKHLQ